MQRRSLNIAAALGLAGALLLSVLPARAADEAPDALIKRLSTEVLDSIKADKNIQNGDMSRIIALVDQKILPNLNFQRMTASAVGPAWRQATPDQQKRLQEEFKTLLVRTYAGALSLSERLSGNMHWRPLWNLLLYGNAQLLHAAQTSPARVSPSSEVLLLQPLSPQNRTLWMAMGQVAAEYRVVGRTGYRAEWQYRDGRQHRARRGLRCEAIE